MKYMTEGLSWQEIEKLYDQQWIELIDFDWPEGEMRPKSGKVRVHSPDRKKFYKLAAVNPPQDSAFLFVGKLKREPGIYLR